MNTKNVNRMVISALLCAIGIIIPMFSPLKFVAEPASFTLGSHIAIFIAMFISPPVGVFVALGTTLGFFLGGFPIVIVLRALTHVIFAFIGAMILNKKKHILDSPIKAQGLSLILALIHALSELSVVTLFYFGNNMSSADYEKGFVTSVLLLVGFGTVVHSMVDFGISQAIWKLVKASGGSKALADLSK